MTINYNKSHELRFYDTGEIEIAESKPSQGSIKWFYYFKNIRQLHDLLKSNSDLYQKLKSIMKLGESP